VTRTGVFRAPAILVVGLASAVAAAAAPFMVMILVLVGDNDLGPAPGERWLINAATLILAAAPAAGWLLLALRRFTAAFCVGLPPLLLGLVFLGLLILH